MLTHDPYMTKAIEYLVGLGFLALFVLFWRFVNGEAEAAPLRAPAWTGQLADWFRMPADVFYHPGHAWARADASGVVTIGMNDFAQQLVGRLAAVELPQPGAQLREGAKGWTLKADSKAVDMLAPVTGTVVAVNPAIAARADVINDDPYGRGWLMKVQPTSGGLGDLLSGTRARKWIEQVAEELTASLSPQLGTVLQDGGVPVHGIARSLDEAHWDAIARRFFEQRASHGSHGLHGSGSMTVMVLMILALAGWSISVAAQSLPKLPDAIAMAKSADSPGQVIFNHASHVDAARPACTSCHPKEFRILKANAAARPITHADMDKGQRCGKCHNGKTSFGLTDDCTMCHQS